MAVFVLAGIFVISGALCHSIAKRLGRRPVLWGVMGCAFGPFALVWLMLSGRKLTNT